MMAFVLSESQRARSLKVIYGNDLTIAEDLDVFFPVLHLQGVIILDENTTGLQSKRGAFFKP
jgi:hypothetical protein